MRIEKKIRDKKMERIKQKIRTSALKSESGFTLVEVLVAIVMFAIVMVFMAKMYAVSTIYVAKQGDRRQATALARETMEQYIALEFSTVESPLIADPTVPAVLTPAIGGSEFALFNCTVTLDYLDEFDFTSSTNVNSNVVGIEIIVSSASGTQGFHDVTLENVITNW